MTFKLRFFIGFICLVAQTAHASLDCSAKSPRLVEQGDKYWEIQPTTQISNVDKNLFLKRVGKFTGRIEGNTHRDECTGSQEKTLIKSTQASVKGSLEQTKDGVKLILEVTDVKDKSVKNERLEFLGRTSTVEFSAAADDSFHMLQKTRANATPGDKISLLRETQYIVSFAKNKLIIHATHFANGFLYAEDNWVLTLR